MLLLLIEYLVESGVWGVVKVALELVPYFRRYSRQH